MRVAEEMESRTNNVSKSIVVTGLTARTLEVGSQNRIQRLQVVAPADIIALDISRAS